MQFRRTFLVGMFVCLAVLLTSFWVRGGDVSDAKIYEVKDGDTLYNISLRHHMSAEELIAFNLRQAKPVKLKNNLIKVGQNIYVPAGSYATLDKSFPFSPQTELVRLKNNDEAKVLASSHESIEAGSRARLISYVVSQGDTLYNIGQRHGLSVDELIALNAKAPVPLVSGNNQIKLGQIIYVPSDRSSVVLPELSSSAEGDRKPVRPNIERQIAAQAARLGQAYGQPLSPEDSAKKVDHSYKASQKDERRSPSFVSQERDYLKSQAQSALQAEATQQAKALLGELGNSEVSLRFDDVFRLKEYAADLLLPITESADQLTFFQGGGRHKSSSGRSIVNLGIGQRNFYDSLMFGYNAFFDHDITRSHSRLGLGAELWADNVKMSANVYSPLSGWRDSPDIEEHLERAARGVDFNAKYYLPQYPQLGFSAKVEHYLGEKVDLLGNNTVERNPYSGSLGMEWQPVPLFKFGGEQTLSKGGQRNTNLNMGVEWKLGASLDDMLNPAHVAQSRKLQGMRYDMVDRNNNIVLEYKEKTRSVTIEHAPVTGLSGSTVTLNPVVSISKGHIVSWQWSSPEPLLQGALSDANVQSPSLLLPQLPLDTVDFREFPLYLTVTDERGGTYQSSMIPVVVYVDPQSLIKVLQIITPGVIASTQGSPHAAMVLADDGNVVEFVLKRSFVGDAARSVSVKPKQVVVSDLVGYSVALLEGGYKQASARSENAEPLWINRIKITPLSTTSAPEQLSFHAVGPTGAPSGQIVLALSTSAMVDPQAAPRINNLRMAGKLEVGQYLTATYDFDANGGDGTDRSTYLWGARGSTASGVLGASDTVTASGVVPQIMLLPADAGEVKELSVQAQNGLGNIGNIITVDALGNASNSDGGSDNSGTDTHGGVDSNGDGQGDVVIDPTNITVRVLFTSSATPNENGSSGVRPVVNRDVMTAQCLVAGEPLFSQCDGRFELQWYVGGLPVQGETAPEFTAGSDKQGLEVQVKATFKP